MSYIIDLCLYHLYFSIFKYLVTVTAHERRTRLVTIGIMRGTIWRALSTVGTFLFYLHEQKAGRTDKSG